jgi:polar amino acid transport system substrate-binding protein
VRGLAVAAAVAAALAASAPAAQAPPTKTPGELVIGLAMPAAGFQVGAARGRDVVLAKGLEIDLARAIARRLAIPRVRFVNEPLFSTLLTGGPKDWDFALAEVTITDARRRRVDFSVPYLTADQAVLVRKGLEPPRAIAALRRLQLCSERTSTGAQLIVERIRPSRKPRLATDPSQLMQLLFRGRCDAAVYDAPVLGVARAEAPDRFGPLAGRIVTGERYAAVLENGSRLAGPLNRALRALLQDGTVARLQKRWLTADVSKLRVLPER